ncbi:P-loop NTPase fold protein [Enterococcus faecalis]|uniref:P-loop NTPase fold protein n=1 Tax=Enterococcus faecalis TaxID=1351 RepID=UPI000330AF17|nr:P-loop NTPase fold protein [Enterococcus faecalis]EOJ55646.1 hypothetical protein WMM_02807 [Enterococcus faecalis EnGen0364]
MLSETKVDDNDILKKIDTTESAKYFSELLEQNSTFFLNGEWGMGKTEFLKGVESYSKKKFINLNLWAIKDDRTAINIAFTILHPFIYNGCKLLFVGCVILSILVTPAVKENLWNFLPGFLNSKIVIVLCTLGTLGVSVWQFFKYKSDSLYYKFLNSNKTKFLLKKKVLVIDDFDRISAENQEGAYKLFNCLNGKLPIIFVGDYSLITKMESKYLQKIINHKIELPVSLYPMNIWEKYFEDLNELLSTNVSQHLINLFIEENRNLRERRMFHYYVEQELVRKNKKYYVQIDQQLAIIYLYLFYPLIYMELLKGMDLNECIADEDLKTIKEILSETEGYPKAFIKNKQGYYLYEVVKKLTESEATLILNGPDLEKEMLKRGNASDDFYHYVSTKYNGMETKQKERLLDKALQNIYNGEDSSLIYLVVTENNKRFKYAGMKEWDICDAWFPILDKHKFDFSQKIYFLEYYLSITFYKLGRMYDSLDLNSEDFIDGKKKGYYFLTFLSMKNKWFNYDWDESYWEALELIYSKNYVEYLMVLKNLLLIDVDFTTKEIVIYKEIYNDYLEKNLENVDKALEKIKPTIGKLKFKDYSIQIKEKRVVNLT